MPQVRSRVAVVALCAVLLTGATNTWPDGKALVAQGSYAEAGRLWADALEADPGDKGARKGLKKYGELAWQQSLDRARELEADGRYADAIPAFDEVIALERVLVSYDLMRFDRGPEDTRAERDATRKRLLEESYVKGLAASQIAQYEAAVTHFEVARSIDPLYQDLPQQLGAAHKALAAVALTSARYEDAVREFRMAFDFTKDPSNLAWAASILAASGRYYLREGACRQAVEAFEKAMPFAVNEPRLDADLATAQECAAVDLVVVPFELAPGITAPAGYDLGSLVSDKLSEQLVAQGSRFVRMIDATAPGEAGAAHRYEVRGRIGRLEVVRPAAKSIRGEATGTVRDLCVGEGGYYTSKEQYCDESVSVSWDQWEQQVEMKLSASVKVVDPATGRQLVTRTHDASAEHTARQAIGFQRSVRDAWTATRVGPEPSKDVVALAPEILALQAEPKPLPSDSDMVSAAAENLAVEAAEEILAAVDGQTTAPPPRVLANIRRPVTSPEDIELAPGDVVTEPNGPGPAPVDPPTPSAETDTVEPAPAP